MKNRFSLLLQIGFFLFALTMARFATAVPPSFVGEELYYQLSYRGLFTAFAEMSVADASLATRLLEVPGKDKPLLESVLTVSSADYDFIEALYPFRYRLRTLYRLDPQGSLAFERIKRTRKLKHDLVWVDREGGHIHRYRLGLKGEGPLLPVALAQWVGSSDLGYDDRRSVPLSPSLESGVLDWLSLLQALRGLPELPDNGLSLPVTDGRKQVIYQVQLEGAELLQANGRKWNTQKYSFTAGEVLDKGEEPPDHNPILVWLTVGPERMPVRLENVHDVGSFVIELREQAPLQEVSVDTPVQVHDSDDSF